MASGSAPAPVSAPGPSPKDMVARIGQALRVVNARLRSGANWFFWIAGLSLVNTALEKTGANRTFVFGLGVAQLVDAATDRLGSTGLGVGVALNLLLAAVFVLFGMRARQKRKWAFLAGMVLYGLDGLLFVLAQDWFSLAFHALALYFLYRGLAARNQAAKLEEMLLPAVVRGAATTAAATFPGPADISNKPIR